MNGLHSTRLRAAQGGVLLALFLPTLFLLMTIPGGFARAQQQFTPSHVYQRAEQLVREIQLLRESKGISAQARDPGVQFGKLPLHVFAKAVEVFEKVTALQLLNGLRPAQVPRIETRNISPALVLGLVTEIHSELVKVKRQMGVRATIRMPRLPEGKIPSDVYQNLWKASFALDGLIPPLTPGHVYRHGNYVLGELRQIAAAMGTTLDSVPLAKAPDRKVTPRDVLVESYKNLYRVGAIERKIGITPFAPPAFPIGKITPSDPFDATSMLLAELVRVKTKLGVTANYQLRPLPNKKSPADVFVLVTQVGNTLNYLAAK